MIKPVYSFICISNLVAASALCAPETGLQELTTTSVWVCPRNVTVLEVEFWGAGGGGSRPENLGGGGGGGGYVKARIAVKPREPYHLVIATGGKQSVSDAPGEAGGTTSISDRHGNVLMYAGGGGGGVGLPPGAKVPGMGGGADPRAGVGRAGHAGYGCGRGISAPSAFDLYGYNPFNDNIAYLYQLRTAGTGGWSCSANERGNGTDGYAVISW